MCCIAYQPAGDKPIDNDTLDNMWNENHHGAGYMFVDRANRQLIVRKPFWKLADLRAAYSADHAAHGASSHFVLHFRWSTHGLKDEVNTHPHILAGGKAALVHNGVLSDFAPDRNSDISDTVLFCRQVLAMRQPSQLTGKRFGRYLAEMIGEYNKFAIMDFTGAVSIINDDKGVWDGARWYSNSDFREPRKVWTGFSVGRSVLPAYYCAGETLWQDDEDTADKDRWAQNDSQWDMWEDAYNAAFERLTVEAEKTNGAIDWTAIDNQAQGIADDAIYARLTEA